MFVLLVKKDNGENNEHLNWKIANKASSQFIFAFNIVEC